tara:strand:+ start:801 stop:1151 length:351 start_codon:yes stop_codon:yes gene_type:complete
MRQYEMAKDDETFTITLGDEPISIGDIAYPCLDHTESTYTITLDSSPTLPEPIYVTEDDMTYDLGPMSSHLDQNKIERMCEHYPALAKSWKEFKTFYDLVKDDFDTNVEDDNEIPF